jgi:hypothetical protein
MVMVLVQSSRIPWPSFPAGELLYRAIQSTKEDPLCIFPTHMAGIV